MAHNLSWIDPETLRTLVSETAYRRLEPTPTQAASPMTTIVVGPPPSPSPPWQAPPPFQAPPLQGPASVAPAPPVPPAPSFRAPEPAPAPAPKVAAASGPRPTGPTGPTGSVRRASRPTLPDPDRLPAPPVRASMKKPFAPEPEATLDARLEQLMAWACQSTGLSRAFIADAEGLLVASRNTGANAVDDAASIVELCARRVPRDVADAASGTVTMVAGERTHAVAWELTRHGKTYIALSGSVEPPPEVLATLGAGLREALR